MENNNLIRTIVIPAYAEEKFIRNTLKDLNDFLVTQDWVNSTEVVVVTADAPDQTQSIVAEAIKIFPNHNHIQPGPRVGKGRDVKAGLSVARGAYVIFMDADLATPLHHLIPAFDSLEKCGGMVIGVRQINKMHKTFIRRASSLISNSIIRAFIGWGIADSQCGFKGFDREALKTILEKSEIMGWGFDFEFIKIAKLHKIKITSLSIPDWKDPKPEGMGLAGESQFSAMKKTFHELITVKKKQLAGDYK